MPIDIHSEAEVKPLITRVNQSADDALRRIRELVEAERDSLVVLHRVKFSKLGRHPLEDRDLNFIEQVNQPWSFLVSLHALPFLFGRHKRAGGFRLCLGTEGGTDILSLNQDEVAAEAFAAVDPRNNDKLKKDRAKLARECQNAQARHLPRGA